MQALHRSSPIPRCPPWPRRTSVEVVEVELVVVGESVTVVVVGGIGVGVGVEPVSANVASAVPVVLPPTAMQNNDGAHETDERRLRSPGGVALGVNGPSATVPRFNKRVVIGPNGGACRGCHT